MFSATLHSPEVKRLAAAMCVNPLLVDLKGQDAVPDTVDHVLLRVDPTADATWLQSTPKVGYWTNEFPVLVVCAHAVCARTWVCSLCGYLRRLGEVTKPPPLPAPHPSNLRQAFTDNMHMSDAVGPNVATPERLLQQASSCHSPNCCPCCCCCCCSAFRVLHVPRPIRTTCMWLMLLAPTCPPLSA
jgi:hypothetical protein